MAVAFYIPDQAAILRKANEQEQRILRMRETQWKLIASIVLEALWHYTLAQNAGGTVRKCRK